MVGFANRRRKKPVLKTAGAGRRVIAVFGPPSSGVSTVLDVLSKSSHTPNIVVPYLGKDSIRQAEEALEHVEVVFLDVDGGAISADDVQEINDNRLVYTTSGAMIRMYAPDEVVLERAAKRPGYISSEDLQRWAISLDPVEAKIRQHILSYFMVPNIELEEAVKQVALRAGIKE